MEIHTEKMGTGYWEWKNKENPYIWIFYNMKWDESSIYWNIKWQDIK